MRITDPVLLNFLNTTRQLVMVDLYTFELKNGTTLRYCTHSAPVTYSGNTWLPAPAGLTRSKIRWVTGVEVDTLDIDLQTDSSLMVGQTPMLAAAVKGLFDNAVVTLSRLFGSDWNTPVGTVSLFQGNTAPAQILRTALHLTVKSDLERLNAQIPDGVYQAPCRHTLYDMSCTVNPNTYRMAGTIGAVNADGSLQVGLGKPDTYFQRGAIKFTSGKNIGVTRTVKAYVGGKVYMTNPLPFDVTVGDAFTITPGCDKLRNGDCLNKYNNVIHFQGFEYIPTPETAA